MVSFMTEKEPIEVGEFAPDFNLKDQNENEIKLSDLKGKRILLSFHPLAWTPVCTKQMQSLEANFDKFEGLNTLALGLSVDSVPSKKAWANDIGLNNTQILADFWPHGEVAKSLGIFRDNSGISERANIILDEDQKVIFVKIYPISELPDITEIIQFLENL
jgi:peroxiredoxin